MKMRMLLLAAAWAACGALAAAEPAPGDFAWRATLDTSGRNGLVRLPLLAEALARLQSRDASDLRVFDAQGQPVAFALATPPRPADAPRAQTPAFRALPLHAAPAGARPPAGVVQLRVDPGSGASSVWVQLGNGATEAAAGTTRALPAALFDTRAQKEAVSGFLLRATIPSNVPVRFTLSTSSDLTSWTPVPAQGRIYRFEGTGAPANDRLELQAPLTLSDRYLRLDWSGQDGVAVESVTGLLAAGEPPRALPSLTLPAPQADGPSALEWQLAFATPIARLDLSTSRDNTLLPLRVLGRDRPSDPWRPLGQALVYRLGEAGQQGANVPAALAHPSVRWLRVEATHGTRLEGVPLDARVQFEPLELVFPAGQGGPYVVAAGRAGTTQAALPVAMLAATTSTRVQDLPAVGIASVQSAPAAAAGGWSRWLPRGMDSRSAGLWLVLVLGVLLLAGVAWSLLRQVNAQRDP